VVLQTTANLYPNLIPSSRGGPILFAIDDLLALEVLSPRDRATRVYGLLRMFLDIPTEARTDALSRLTAAIDDHPERKAIHSALREFWSHHSYVRVISEAGLPEEAFLLRELLARALRHLLPVDEVEGDLYVLMDSLNLKESDARWLGTLPDSIAASWADIFRPSSSSILASCKILALRATNIALSRDLIDFADDEDITKSSFFNLPAVVERAVRHPEDFHCWEEQRAACEAQVQSVNRLLAEKGSSADLVFRVRLLRSLLGRIQQVITLEQSGSDARKLSIVIVHGFASQRRIGTVLSASTRRLARSVVERTGRTGKHYIARNAAQWRAMGFGAILAGLITSFTALFKYSLSSAIHAPMLLAFALSMNYVVSFLLMQAGGFLLASKMPAATAATLVDAMEDPEKDHMASLQAISETQFIVTVSNLVGAVPISILIDRIFHAVTGHPFLTAAEAEHGVHMLFPHTSMTIIFAVVTGVFLWLSSLATGWTANYLALHKMATAISNSLRIRDRLGPKRAAMLANWVGHHAAGSVGFIVLGFLLGAVPIIFELFGIPLEVRHVTLAAASLGYALDGARLYGQLHWRETILALSGIGMVGVLNICTSFALSYVLAVRARNIGEAQSRRFLREVWREVLANPLTFLLPRR
jgi:site-specific recombinase